MKITQNAEYSMPAKGSLPPLQALVYEELIHRSD